MVKTLNLLVYYGVGGLNMGGIGLKGNSCFGDNNSDVPTPTKPRTDFFDTREVGEIDGIDRLLNDAKGVNTNKEPSKGVGEINPGDDKKQKVHHHRQISQIFQLIRQYLF